MEADKNGKLQWIYTDKSILTGRNFKLPAGAIAKEIKFTIDDKTMYYDLVGKRWKGAQASPTASIEESAQQQPQTQAQAQEQAPVEPESQASQEPQQSQEPQTSQEQEQQNAATATDADYATLYIYRPKKMAGLAISYDLHLENEPIFRVKNNSKKTVKVTRAGVLRLLAETESTTELPISNKLGEEYYIRCGISMGVVVGRPKLELVDPEIGKKEFDKIKEK